MIETLSFGAFQGFRIRDRVSYAWEPNRYRCRVFTIPSSTTLEIRLFIRPSRGFARHIRKQKRKRNARS